MPSSFILQGETTLQDSLIYEEIATCIVMLKVGCADIHKLSRLKVGVKEQVL